MELLNKSKGGSFMSFAHTTIMVKDMKESLQFYQEIVGLSIARRFPIDTGEIVFLGDGETKVELIYNRQLKEVSYGEHISLGFSVESLDKTMEFVKEKGIEIHSGPIEPNPATRFFFVLDPNGLRVQFIETK